MHEYAVILVHATSHAIQVERVLQDHDLGVKLIPTPRHLSSDCGAAVRVESSQIDRLRQLLDAAGAPYDRVDEL